MNKNLNMNQSTYRKYWMGIGMISLLWIGGCKNHSDTKENHKKDTIAAAPAATEAFVVNDSGLLSKIRIPGELMSFQQVDLYAKLNSYIKKLNADVGSNVHAGQTLAQLDAPELSAQLNAAESRLKSQEALYLASKANYDRLYETSKTPGTISRNDLDQANAKQKSDLAQLDAAKANFHEISDMRSYLQIKAPFDGVISGRNFSAGAYVGPGGKGTEPIFTLQQQDRLRLVVSVPETYSVYLKTNTEISFEVSSLAGQQFKAKIARMAGALDNKLRAQRIEMDVINTQKLLLPGMVAEVTIPLVPNKNARTVPAAAVLNATQGTFVIAVKSQKTIWIPVKTGRTFEGRTEVFGALNTGDTLLTHAAEEVRNGSILKTIRVK